MKSIISDFKLTSSQLNAFITKKDKNIKINECVWYQNLILIILIHIFNVKELKWKINQFTFYTIST